MCEKRNYILIDNSVFKTLIKKGNENLANNFYDLLKVKDINFVDVQCESIFTGLSLLEAIGLGGIKKSVKIALPQTTFNNKEEFIRIFNENFDKAYCIYKKHEEIQAAKLVQKIHDEITIFSTNTATKELVDKTLGLYLNDLKVDPDGCVEDIAIDLAWDTACGFKYIDMNAFNKHDCLSRKELINDIYNVQFTLWYRLKKEGWELSPYVITDRFQKNVALFPDYKELAKDCLGYKSINSINFVGELGADKDLCDADLIHFITLGKYDLTRQKHVPDIAFTCESQNIIQNRV